MEEKSAGVAGAGAEAEAEVEAGAGAGAGADRWRLVATEQTLKAGGRRKSKYMTRQNLRCLLACSALCLSLDTSLCATRLTLIF